MKPFDTQRPNHDPGAVRPPDFVLVAYEMDTSNLRCRSWEELEVHLKCIYERQTAILDLLGDVIDKQDTQGSPWWKRLLFWIDGWGPWYKLRDGKHGRPNGPVWRPWRKWWTS